MPVTPAVRAVTVASLAVLITACSARAHCTGERPYQQADTVRVLEDIEDIKVPRSSSALTVPEAPTEGPAYAERYEDEDGNERIRCLDAPPRLDPLEDDSEVAPA
jgi:hypothetical protein